MCISRKPKAIIKEIFKCDINNRGGWNQIIYWYNINRLTAALISKTAYAWRGIVFSWPEMRAIALETNEEEMT